MREENLNMAPVTIDPLARELTTAENEAKRE
jgi:hypothetical protein